MTMIMEDMHDIEIPFNKLLLLGEEHLLSPKMAETNIFINCITFQPPKSASSSPLSSAERIALVVVPLSGQNKNKEFILASLDQSADAGITSVMMDTRIPVLRKYSPDGVLLRLKLLKDVVNGSSGDSAKSATRRQRGVGEDGADDSSTSGVIISGVQQTMLTAGQVAALKNAAKK